MDKKSIKLCNITPLMVGVGVRRFDRMCALLQRFPPCQKVVSKKNAQYKVLKHVLSRGYTNSLDADETPSNSASHTPTCSASHPDPSYLTLNIFTNFQQH